ncbi:CD4-1 molecule [Pseudorasbora parva]|uniref:CD4-1 molecule n=1 Tax=Pseudorasbora parva TaxID=51549 RepID=UPI00351E61D1
MMFSWILISLFVRFLKAQESMVIYAQIGGTAILPRDLSIKAENVYVNWHRESEEKPTIMRNPQSGIQKGKDVKTHVSLLPNYSLQISPVQESDFKVWHCRQHVLTSVFEKTYKLYHVTIPKVPTVMSGDSLSLECKLDTSSVKTSVTWISPQNSDCSQIVRSGKKISVNNVSRCHSGVWTCKVDYDGKEARATTTVSVIDLSPPPPDPIYTSVSPSSTVRIPCSLSSNIPWSVLNNTGLQGGSWSFTPDSDPSLQRLLLNLSVGPVVKWVPTHDDYKTMEREIKDQDLFFNLPVEEKFRGEYTCNLKFNSKNLSSKVKVEVLKFSSSEGPRVYEGKKVNLTCTLGHPIADDLEIKLKCRTCSTLPSSSFLSIPEVKMEHSGQWTCELKKNYTKLTYAMLSLKIEKAPVDIWLCVAIIGGVVGFILLLVVVFIGIRRHKQMMMYRRRKTRFCCCKSNPQPKGFYKT